MNYNQATEAQMVAAANKAISNLKTNAACFTDDIWYKANRLSKNDISLSMLINTGFISRIGDGSLVTYSIITDKTKRLINLRSAEADYYKGIADFKQRSRNIHTTPDERQGFAYMISLWEASLDIVNDCISFLNKYSTRP